MFGSTTHDCGTDLAKTCSDGGTREKGAYCFSSTLGHKGRVCGVADSVDKITTKLLQASNQFPITGSNILGVLLFVVPAGVG